MDEDPKSCILSKNKFDPQSSVTGELAALTCRLVNFLQPHISVTWNSVDNGDTGLRHNSHKTPASSLYASKYVHPSLAGSTGP